MSKKIFFIFFILFIIALPLLLRLFNQNYVLPGDDVYTYLLNEKMPGESLPIIGSIFSHLPYLFMIFLPLCSVVISFILLIFILRKLKIKKEFFFVFLFVLALSPLTQSLSFFVDANTFVLPIFLLGLLLLLKKKPILAAMPLIFTSLISPEHALVNIFVVFAVKKYWFKDQKLNFLASVIAVLFLIFHLPSFFHLSGLNLETLFVGFFSEFGSSFGFGIFELFLACFGLVYLLKYKKEYYYLVGLLCGILFLSFFFPKLRIYSLLVVAFLSMTIICKLLHRKWFIKSLKNIVLFTIFCGLLFTSISHAITISEAAPSMKFAQGLIVLAKERPGNVLTFQDYSDFVEFYSQKNPLIKQEEISSGLFSDYLNMLYSNDILETIKLMRKYEIRYIIITPEMKDKLWNNKDEDLIFLLKHSKYFKKIIWGSQISIWEVDYAVKV